MNVMVPLGVALVLAAAFGASVVLNVVQRLCIRSMVETNGEFRLGASIGARVPAAHSDALQDADECASASEGQRAAHVELLAKRAEYIAAVYHLTPRESEVLALMLDGHGTARIAERMVVSASTIKSHTYNIYGKMGVHSHQEMIDACEAVENARNKTARPACCSGVRAHFRSQGGVSRNVA